MQQRGRPPHPGAYRVPPRSAWTARQSRESRSSGGARAAGLLLALIMAATLGVHALALATSPGAAGRTLRATLPAITDLDQSLAAHATELEAAGRDATSSVVVPGLVVPVEVRREAAATGGDDLRRATVEAMVRWVYVEGHSAFRVSGVREVSAPAPLSSQWMVRRSIDLLTARQHGRLVNLSRILAVGAVAVTALLAIQIESSRRALAVGSALTVGSLLAAVGALVVRGVGWMVMSDGSVASAVVARIARDVTMTIVVAALVSGLASAALAVGGWLIARMDNRPARAASPARARQAGLGRERREEL